ncbi:MAG: hypothetical protein WCK58_08085 [Chloroflexota bacterium]
MTGVTGPTGLPVRLSIPSRRRTPPRPLAGRELAGFLRIADALLPGTERDPAPSACNGYEEALLRSLAARADAFDELVVVAAGLADAAPDVVPATLRRLHDSAPDTFQALSAVVAGAYFQLPEVLERLGYPRQRRSPARMEQIVEELETGILDPVIARGPIYVPDGAE